MCVCVCVCVCREFIVVCECERVHLSLSLLFLRAVYCLIQWLRNEACRKPGKMSKGLFTVALQLVHSRHVTGCGSRHASGSGTERNGVPASVCVQSLFFSLFLVAIVLTLSMVNTFIEAAAEQQELNTEGNTGREGVTCIHDYGNMPCSA